jgi:hypothetical protein
MIHAWIQDLASERQQELLLAAERYRLTKVAREANGTRQIASGKGAAARLLRRGAGARAKARVQEAEARRGSIRGFRPHDVEVRL